MSGIQHKLVCIYAGSSKSCPAEYQDAAQRLGRCLSDRGFAIIYGGGGSGLMGALADAALARGGRVIGVLPRFMDDLEWGHRGLSRLHVVDDLKPFGDERDQLQMETK